MASVGVAASTKYDIGDQLIRSLLLRALLVVLYSSKSCLTSYTQLCDKSGWSNSAQCVSFWS